MARVVHLPARVAIFVIRVYQMSLGRLLGERCRFHPSCSRYAIDAIEAYGLIRGGARAFWRVARCGPWTAGGLDPVRRAAHSGAVPRG